MRTALQQLVGGVFVDVKRGPNGPLHAISTGCDSFGARRSVCKVIGRFVPPGATFETFPEDPATSTPPPVREVPCR